jgi:mannosyltransferase OCH1-like enzyme
MQFWDRPEVPPEVAATMQTWEDTPGFAYRRFDKSGARAFLHDRLGPDWARAFRAARHPAEQADFFRLAFLAVEGGIYADADDCRIGDLAALVRGIGGALLCVEPFGAVANNFLVAPPGHPVFARAADEACRSLLSRDSGGIWAKTGPGLLTRSVARYLVEEAGASGPTVCLRRGNHFAPVVQFHARMAYKAAPEYWNARRIAGDAVELRASVVSALHATPMP